MRIDKYLSHSTSTSRQEVKRWIKKGEICVNGEVVKSAKQQIDERQDTVLLSGQPLVYQSDYYYMMYKPAGVITATCDVKQRTVMDVLQDKDRRSDLFPVGRLDKDTTGLLLLTNNGPLAHDLLAPKKHVDKIYEALIEGIVTDKEVDCFKAGISLDGQQLQPAQLEIVQRIGNDKTFVRLNIHEGKFHQVKRMFQSVGMKVLKLHRIQMGLLTLDPSLKPGDYRPLTEGEIQQLKERRK